MKPTGAGVLAFVVWFLASVTAHGWVTEVLDPDLAQLQGTTSIALDSSDNGHIAYYDGYPDHLPRYITDASGSWVIETIDSEGGSNSSIALDSSNNVHISYLRNGLNYTTNASGSWERVGLGGGGSHSIATDSLDNVHIGVGYNVMFEDEFIGHITNASGPWLGDVVNSDATFDLSMTLDSADNVHIVYILDDYSGCGLTYATNASGSWVTTIIAYSGAEPDIAADSFGNAHISFFGGGSYPDLMYATNAGGSWAITTVDSPGGVGYASSIAVDHSDNVHISYQDFTNKSLKYATNAGGSWVTMTASDWGVDWDVDCGRETSIAITSEGSIRISHLGWYGSVLLLTSSSPCVDNDGDGYGDPATPECPRPAWDCDDADPQVPSGLPEGPFGDETCSDTLDNDCDGDVDDADSGCCECIDNDGDEYGDPGCENCTNPERDCDDTEPDVNPGVSEDCSNGIDDNCNGLADCIGAGDPQCDCGYSAAANAEASAYGPESLIKSGVMNQLALLLVPVGAVILLRVLRRRR
jgi:hypothetical protein